MGGGGGGGGGGVNLSWSSSSPRECGMLRRAFAGEDGAFRWRQKRKLLDRMEDDDVEMHSRGDAYDELPGQSGGSAGVGGGPFGPSKERRRVLHDVRQNCSRNEAMRVEGPRSAGSSLKHNLDDHQLRHAQVQKQEMERFRRMQEEKEQVSARECDSDMADAGDATMCGVVFDYEGNMKRERENIKQRTLFNSHLEHSHRVLGAPLLASKSGTVCEHCGCVVSNPGMHRVPRTGVRKEIHRSCHPPALFFIESSNISSILVVLPRRPRASCSFGILL